MVPPSEAQSNTPMNGHRHSAETDLAKHLISAAPLRTKQAAAELATTLEELGADPCVVQAARRA